MAHTSTSLPWCYCAEFQWEKVLLIGLENYGVKIEVTVVEIYHVPNISILFFSFFLKAHIPINIHPLFSKRTQIHLA